MLDIVREMLSELHDETRDVAENAQMAAQEAQLTLVSLATESEKRASEARYAAQKAKGDINTLKIEIDRIRKAFKLKETVSEDVCTPDSSDA